MRLTIDLTESQWSEVANAVATKLFRVRDGQYGDEGREDWERDLESAYNRITDVLQEKGVSY